MVRFIKLYRYLTARSEGILKSLLRRRLRKGKEDPSRFEERMGRPSLPSVKQSNPDAKLIWLHAASVGEAQSAMILLDRLFENYAGFQVLVTTGTVTSAQLMQKKLPEHAFHQYIPLDHPQWVTAFLDHWQPDLVLWMESELWPNMLLEVQARKISLALINARLSDQSYARWQYIRRSAQDILGAFDLILCQTPEDQIRFKDLGARVSHITDNIKYSAKPLSYEPGDLQRLSAKIGRRTGWLYASTHAGEEALACRLHQILKNSFPDLLTVIVPRHPERRADIMAVCEAHQLKAQLRGSGKDYPEHDTDIYIADTLGELGLFYRLMPLACIGRSFSDDGGGGHNPLEAAQLNCAVLHGPHVQNLRDIYDEMRRFDAAIALSDEDHFLKMLQDLLGNPENIMHLQKQGNAFSASKRDVVETVLEHLRPFCEAAGLKAQVMASGRKARDANAL